MSSYVVYIDHESAKIFKMDPKGTKEVNLHKHIQLHHKNNQENKKKDSSGLYHDVAAQIKDASEVLILGHGNAKEQFVHHLQNHHHEQIAKKIAGVESVDHPTENQILALARKFFKSYHQLKSN